MKRTIFAIPALAAVTALTFTSCAGDSDATGEESPPPMVDVTEEGVDQTNNATEAGVDNGPDDTTPNESDTGPDDADGAEQSTGTEPVPDADLPGEEITTHFSEEGAAAHVNRVKSGDVLFVRGLPDPNSTEVGRFAPTGEATLAGRERLVDSGIWAEVQLEDGVGWVNTHYLAFLAEPGQDITDEFDELEPAADHAQLAADAAQLWTDNIQPGTPPVDWVMVETPAHDTLMYRADITGLPDDSLSGTRLEMLIVEADGAFEIDDVNSIPICGRGVAEENLCL